MASTLSARKRAARSLPILFSILWLVACGGPSKPAIDLDSSPRGTDRERLRTAMAQESPIFFETLDGERFYGEVLRTNAQDFELSMKEPYEGDSAIPMSDETKYRYADIARAEPVPEEGNSTRGFVLGTTVIVVALFAVVALVATFPVPSS